MDCTLPKPGRVFQICLSEGERPQVLDLAILNVGQGGEENGVPICETLNALRRRLSALCSSKKLTLYGMLTTRQLGISAPKYYGITHDQSDH